MLQAGHTTNVSFKVNVMGTSSDPKVRLILGTTPEMTFHAKKGEGDSWGAEVLVPKHIDAGSYDMRVEVVLNNRLFTPLNKKIEIGIAPQEVKAPEVAAEVPPAEPTVVQAEPATLEPKVAPEPPKVQVKMPIIQKKAEAKQEDAEPASLSMLKSFAEKAPKKMYERIKTPMPKPGSIKIQPVQVRISEIDAVTTEVVSHVVEAVKAAKSDAKPSKSKRPVKLVKEELFYA